MRLSHTIEDVLTRFRDVALRAGTSHGMRGDDLDDVMQDVRIRLWRAADVEGKLETLTPSYIYRAVASAALDFLRRRRARPESPLDEAPEGDATRHAAWSAGATPRADGALLEQETLAQVAAAIDALPPNRRAVVRMHLAGYDREEIAALLRWSEAKTRNLLYRGLADLRENLHARGIGPGGTT